MTKMMNVEAKLKILDAFTTQLDLIKCSNSDHKELYGKFESEKRLNDLHLMQIDDHVMTLD